MRVDGRRVVNCCRFQRVGLNFLHFTSLMQFGFKAVSSGGSRSGARPGREKDQSVILPFLPGDRVGHKLADGGATAQARGGLRPVQLHRSGLLCIRVPRQAPTVGRRGCRQANSPGKAQPQAAGTHALRSHARVTRTTSVESRCLTALRASHLDRRTSRPRSPSCSRSSTRT